MPEPTAFTRGEFITISGIHPGCFSRNNSPRVNPDIYPFSKQFFVVVGHSSFILIAHHTVTSGWRTRTINRLGRLPPRADLRMYSAPISAPFPMLAGVGSVALTTSWYRIAPLVSRSLAKWAVNIAMWTQKPRRLATRLKKIFPGRDPYDRPVVVTTTRDNDFLGYINKVISLPDLLRRNRRDLPELLLALERTEPLDVLVLMRLRLSTTKTGLILKPIKRRKSMPDLSPPMYDTSVTSYLHGELSRQFGTQPIGFLSQAPPT
jgi:hypothetical protein